MKLTMEIEIEGFQEEDLKAMALATISYDLFGLAPNTFGLGIEGADGIKIKQAKVMVKKKGEAPIALHTEEIMAYAKSEYHVTEHKKR